MVSSDSGVPVGLFGEQKITMSGSCSRIAATAVLGEISKSASLSALIHAVPVPEAMMECIE